MIQLANIQEWRTGSLWFVIPQDLQAAMPDYIRSKFNEVTKDWCLPHYVECLMEASRLEDYTGTIHARGHYGFFVFYASNGIWRCGDRGGIDRSMLNAAQAEVIENIRIYAESKQVI